jgi:hypothetical protein
MISMDTSSPNSSRLEPLEALVGPREGRVLRRGPSNGPTSILSVRASLCVCVVPTTSQDRVSLQMATSMTSSVMQPHAMSDRNIRPSGNFVALHANSAFAWIGVCFCGRGGRHDTGCMADGVGLVTGDHQARLVWVRLVGLDAIPE